MPMWIVVAAVVLLPSLSAGLYALLVPALSGEGIVAGLIAIVASSAATAALCLAKKCSSLRLLGLTAMTAMLSLVAIALTVLVWMASCGADCFS